MYRGPLVKWDNVNKIISERLTRDIFDFGRGENLENRTLLNLSYSISIQYPFDNMLNLNSN